MARISLGPKVKQRSQQLFLALLDYANYQRPPLETQERSLREPIELKWLSETELMIKTKLRYLQTLTAQGEGETALTLAQIRESLNRFQDYLGILQDYRVSTQGSGIWHFCLKFWHDRRDRNANLQRFEEEWERCRQHKPEALPSITASSCRQSWEGKIDISSFYGRSEELRILEMQILLNRCKLFTVLGMGGMGKTSLATKFAQQVQGNFDIIFWRSLRHAPLPQQFLKETVGFLSSQTDIQGQLNSLLQWCQTYRCLLVLDNVETILQSGDLAGHYRPGYEGYGEFFHQIGTGHHQSCLMLTSREKPVDIAPLEGDQSVYSLVLTGSSEAALGIVKEKGLQGTAQEKQTLCEQYSHSPLALKIASGSIQDLFQGDISLFLAEESPIFNGIRRLLQQQLKRLSSLEQSILNWLAINREWTTIRELGTDLIPITHKPDILEALESLVWRNLIEVNAGQYTLQPVVMEHVTSQLSETISSELITLQLSQFSQYALKKNTVLEYVRDSQVRFILDPIATYLRQSFSTSQALKSHIKKIFRKICDSNSCLADYSAGNLINLCIKLDIDLPNYDFSNLHIRQVDFHSSQLTHLNLSHATLHHCLFTQAFGGIASLAYHPEGHMIAVGDTEGTVRLWNTDGDIDHIAVEQPHLSLSGHLGPIIALAWEPNGQRLVTGSQDCLLKIWDLSTGACLHTLLGHRKAVWDTVWSPNGQLIVSSSGDRTIKVWNPDSGICLETLKGHESIVYSLALSPDGKTLVSGSEDRSIQLWNFQNRTPLKTLPLADARVRCVAWSPDGSRFASGSGDRLIRIWDGQTGELLRTLSLPTIWINTLAWSSDSKWLASGGYGDIRLWNPDTGECLRVLQGHEEQVWGLSWHPEHLTLASGAHDQTIRLWKPQMGQCQRVIRGYFDSIRNVVWSPNGEKLASCSTDGLVRVWARESGHCEATLEGHQGWLFSVNWHPKQPLVASSGVDTDIRIWNVQSQQCVQTLSGHATWVWSVAWSPDGQFLASGSSTGDLTVRIWEPSTGDCLQVLKGHKSWIWWVAWHPDGTRLATTGDDHTIIIWDVTSGEPLQTLEDSQLLGCALAWSPDGQWLATSGVQKTVKVWNIDCGCCEYELKGHQGLVWAIAWSPNGRWLVSGGDDAQIKLWNMGNLDCEQTYTGHTDRIWDIAWSPTQDLFASSSRDGTIRIWDPSSRDIVRLLRSERPYEGWNIHGTQGITSAQKDRLKRLGAIDQKPSIKT